MIEGAGTKMSSTTQSPPGTIELKQMAVTQFVSVLLYTSVFFTIWDHAEFAVNGFGSLTGDFFGKYLIKDDPNILWWLKLFILGGIVAANAIRYHLSFWSVEENRGFRALCEWADKNKLRWHIRGDLFLRVVSYIVLFLLQLSCTKKGGIPEELLVLLFLILVSWDILILRTAYLHERAVKGENREQREAPKRDTWKARVLGWLGDRWLCSTTATAASYMRRAWRKEGDIPAEVASFKSDVCHWLIAEFLAFCCMALYLVWVLFSTKPVYSTLILFAFLGIASFALAVWDIMRNWLKYWRIVPWLLFFGAVLLTVMARLGLDR
jgi:hypothetical protein